MKYCPQCSAQYDYDMSFCLEDGTPLQISDDIIRTEKKETTRQTETIPQTSSPQTNKEIEKIGEETLALPPTHPSNPNSQPENVIPLPIPPISTTIPVSQPTLIPGEHNQPVSSAAPTDNWTNKQTNAQQELPSIPNQAVTTTALNDKSTPRKPRTGALLAVAAAGLLLIVSAIGGILYFRPHPGVDVATANTAPNINKPSPSQSATPENPAENINGPVVYGVNEAPGNNKTVNANEKPSPKPSATTENTPKITPTPENKPTENETPIPKTPTPTPTLKPTPNNSGPVPGGVLNDRAAFLVMPVIPPAARADGVSGQVNVRVLIDENGNVLSANAVSGPPRLRGPAENAARRTKFLPMTSGNQRVKVTGVIIYNINP